ncbi:MAG: PhnD/SsuA/transferrin family substrate-binding protein [Chloroflexi bacterium]|nr:PhnD/SsuA/transferrin family substrate-binding protein [Chloroflexota bacterium]
MPRTYRVYTFLAPALLPVYQVITRYLARQLNYPMELQVGQSYDDLAHADFSFICGLPYVLRTLPRRSPPQFHALAAPVLIGERYQERPIYFSDVIVHRDSPHQTFADLRGCTWTYNEPESQSGYGITRYHLLRLGETNGYFGRVLEAGFHQQAIRLVAEQQVDAAAIDSHVLEIELRDHPRLAQQLRIVDSFGPSTIQPFVAAAHISESVQREVQDILTEMHTDDKVHTSLTSGLISRFVAVKDADYDDIRGMLSACEQAGFWTLR